MGRPAQFRLGEASGAARDAQVRARSADTEWERGVPRTTTTPGGDVP